MAGQIPENYHLTRPAKLDGDAVVTYPYNTTHRRVERYFSVPRGTDPTAWAALDKEYTTTVLTDRSDLGGDAQNIYIYEVYEDLPGAELVSSRFDAEGGVIIEKRQAVLEDAANVPTASGATTVRYESRGNSALVALKITTITALDNVVRSLPTRVRLNLPRVLAGIAVTYNVTKGEGDDDGSGSGGSVSGTSYSGTNSSSSRASSSLTVIPEIYAPFRDDIDTDNVPAIVKQVYLSSAITEAAILAKLSATYEVAITGTLTPDATGTFLGNSSDIGGIIWFSLGTYRLVYDPVAGKWKLGTAAGIGAGNYWSRTAGPTAWLGAYTAVGTVTGTATVGAGRTVNAWPNWGTQEIVLIKGGKQVSVSSNASASESVGASPGGGNHSTSLNSGFSVSTGGNSGRETIPPTLHGAIMIANQTYTESVNATASAPLAASAPFTCAGIDSGFSPSHAQTVVAYVRHGGTAAIPATVPADLPVSGLWLHPNYQTSPFDAVNTRVNATIIDFTQFARAITSLEYSDPAPHYHIPAGAIQPNQPIYLGGAPTSYAITPSLAGLVFDTTTGIISGTPAATSPNTRVHTVTATNTFGSVTTTVTITTTNP